jgi:hypothetical protein
VAFRDSFGIIVGRIRKVILGTEPGADESVPRLYELLIRSDEGSDAVHVSTARYLKARGESGQARRRLNGLTVLSPRAAMRGWRAPRSAVRSVTSNPHAKRRPWRQGLPTARLVRLRSLRRRLEVMSPSHKRRRHRTFTDDNNPSPLKRGETCLVPLDDSDASKFCSKPAVEKRVFEGLWFPICADHVRELDEAEEPEDDEP